MKLSFSSDLLKVVISIGNPLKADDNIANLVVERLQKIIKDPRIKFLIGYTNPENFIECVRDLKPEKIFFVDVAFFPGEVGEVKLFKLNEIAERSISTTHDFPISIFKKFFPDSQIFLIGIKPKNLEFNQKISRELEEKFEIICEKVKSMIEFT